MKPRPIIRYHGGKHRLAQWIISFFPDHRCYVEPYGGAASVLIRKPRAYAEIYNDLDGEIVNLFRVVRDDGDQLKRKLELTPFSRNEFVESYEPSPDPIEQARRTICRAFMGFSSSSVTKQRHVTGRLKNATTGFRSNSNRSGTTPAHDWMNYPKKLHLIIERLQGVVIDNKSALDVMTQHDSPKTLHYVDPPYVPKTRDRGTDYKYEMTEDHHIEMIECLKQLTGMVIVSGYRSELYDRHFAQWHREDKHAFADGASPRTESLWFSPNFSNTTKQRTFWHDKKRYI